VPRTFPGLGPDTLVPVLKPSALAGLKLGAEEGFVLSRVDGRLTVGQICLLVPFDADVTATILTELFRMGALDIPGAQRPPPQPVPVPVPVPVPDAPAPKGTTVATPSGTSGTGTGTGTGTGNRMVEGLDLTVDQAARIDAFFTSLSTRDAFELLEISRTADKKEVKRAYFKMSKELHPDRFFGKNIGPYRERLSKIFQSVKAAYELLSDDARRAAYLDSVK
jgi:DnaJ-domain-containing protein 1